VYRSTSTTTLGSAFSNEVLRAVWNKGQIVPNCDPASIRADACGALMVFLCYGDTNSKFGWEVDHIVPVSAGGSDALSNLQPLQWQNNRSKGDHLGSGWSCAVR